MKVVWARRARDDLLDIALYVARDKPEAALDWIDKLQRRAEEIPTAPRRSRMVPEIERDDVREVIVGNYRLVYRIEPKRIVVLTVFEGHRLLEHALGRADDEPE